MRKISESTVRRLSLYLRFLEQFDAQGHTTVSSAELARRGATTSAQVRKDLSFFGSFGKRGLGYSVPELTGRLREILGLKRTYRVVLVGAGRIGGALAQYPRVPQRGVPVAAIYAKNPRPIGAPPDRAPAGPPGTTTPSPWSWRSGTPAASSPCSSASPRCTRCARS